MNVRKQNHDVGEKRLEQWEKIDGENKTHEC